MGRNIRTRVNRQIRISEVRVIDSEGNQLGIMPTPKALALAEEQGFDLVEISPTSRPPVCRIMDYGKFKYEQRKRQKESKKKQHVIQVKEIKLRPKTEEHDYKFKLRHAEGFLEKNNKVKFTVVFRGRELSHKDMGFKMLKRVKEDLAHVGTVEKPAGFEGRLMVMIMAPGASKEKEKEKPKEQPKEQVAEQPKEQAAEQPKEQAAEQPKEQAAEQPKEQAAEQPKEQKDDTAQTE